jgi:hypothetical protein
VVSVEFCSMHELSFLCEYHVKAGLMAQVMNPIIKEKNRKHRIAGWNRTMPDCMMLPATASGDTKNNFVIQAKLALFLRSVLDYLSRLLS